MEEYGAAGVARGFTINYILLVDLTSVCAAPLDLADDMILEIQHAANDENSALERILNAADDMVA